MSDETLFAIVKLLRIENAYLLSWVGWLSWICWLLGRVRGLLDRVSWLSKRSDDCTRMCATHFTLLRAPFSDHAYLLDRVSRLFCWVGRLSRVSRLLRWIGRLLCRVSRLSRILWLLSTVSLRSLVWSGGGNGQDSGESCDDLHFED